MGLFSCCTWTRFHNKAGDVYRAQGKMPGTQVLVYPNLCVSCENCFPSAKFTMFSRFWGARAGASCAKVRLE